MSTRGKKRTGADISGEKKGAKRDENGKTTGDGAKNRAASEREDALRTFRRWY